MSKTVFDNGTPSLGVKGTQLTAEQCNGWQNHLHDGGDADGHAPLIQPGHINRTGLDADLLDGHHAADFMTTFGSGNASLPGGLQLRWGTTPLVYAAESSPVVFTPAFTTACFVVTSGFSELTAADGLKFSAITAAGFTATNNGLGPYNGATQCMYLAIGN